MRTGFLLWHDLQYDFWKLHFVSLRLSFLNLNMDILIFSLRSSDTDGNTLYCECFQCKHFKCNPFGGYLLNNSNISGTEAVSWSTEAAVIKYHRPGGLKNGHSFLIVGDWEIPWYQKKRKSSGKSKIKVVVSLVLAEDLLSTLQKSSSLNVLTW
jgi:hypothetical protein